MLTFNVILMISSLTFLTFVRPLPQQEDEQFVTEFPQQMKDEISILSILTDIKQLIKEPQSGDRTCTEACTTVDHLKKDMETDMSHTKRTVDILKDSFEKLSEKNNQNVELMMQSFSALKMLVAVQSEQIKHSLGRIDAMEKNVQNFLNKINGNFISNKLNNKDKPDLDLDMKSVKVEESIVEDMKQTIKSSVIKELGHQIEFRDRVTNSSIRSIRSDITDVKRDLRNIKNDVNGVLEQLMQEEDIPKDSPSSSLTGECSCQRIRSSLTRLNRETQENKKVNENIMDRIESIEQYKNETSPEKFSTAIVISRLGLIEKQIELLPSLESTFRQFQNNTTSCVNETVKPPEPLCVWPYSAAGEGCFYVHTKDRFPWQEARDYCKEIQGDLASPLYFDKFRQFLIAKRLSRSYNIWVGSRDEADEGTWVWLDGRQVENGPKVWSSGRPNVDNRANCMELRPTFRFVAADEDCRSHRQFVCEQRRQ